MAHRGRQNANDALMLALAAGKTLRDAAAAAGIGERTAARRWADPEFRRQVGELRGEMIDRALGKMADGMADAADTLRGLLGAESESVRLGAAKSLLELAVKLREADTLHAERDAGAAEPMGTGDVVTVLGARLRQIDQSERLTASEKARLTATLADALLRAIGVDVMDKRLEALQAVLIGRKDKMK